MAGDNVWLAEGRLDTGLSAEDFRPRFITKPNEPETGAAAPASAVS
jgi:hypothetical protein